MTESTVEKPTPSPMANWAWELDKKLDELRIRQGALMPPPHVSARIAALLHTERLVSAHADFARQAEGRTIDGSIVVFTNRSVAHVSFKGVFPSTGEWSRRQDQILEGLVNVHVTSRGRLTEVRLPMVEKNYVNGGREWSKFDRQTREHWWAEAWPKDGFLVELVYGEGAEVMQLRTGDPGALMPTLLEDLHAQPTVK